MDEDDYSIFSCCRNEHRYDSTCILTRKVDKMDDDQLTKCDNPSCNRKVPVIPYAKLYCCSECKEADLNLVVIDSHSPNCNNRTYKREREERANEKSIQEKEN